MSKKGIQWTPKQVAVAELLRGGADSQAVIAKGYSKTMVSNVKKALASGQVPPVKHPETHPETNPETPKQQIHSTSGETHIKTRTLESVGVGEILIEPADWRINQYGGLLILGTYEHARRILNYAGSVGDFLCDITQLVRMMMGLDMVATDYLVHKEDDNGRREETGGGAGVLAEVRESAAGAESEPGGEI